MLTREKKKCLINFTEQQNKFCLSLPYNGVNSYLFVNDVEIYKLKAKDSGINAAPLYLHSISNSFSVYIMKNAGLSGYVYDFSVDYGSIDVDDILGYS